MFFKAIGQPLDSAKQVWESRWEMPKGFRIASGQFLKAVGKPPENAQIKLIPTGQTFPLAGPDEKSGK